MYKTLLLLSFSIFLSAQVFAVSDTIATSACNVNSKLHVNVAEGMISISLDSLDCKHIKILDQNGHLILSQATSSYTEPIVFSAYSMLYYYTLHTTKGILSGIIRCEEQKTLSVASQ